MKFHLNIEILDLPANARPTTTYDLSRISSGFAAKNGRRRVIELRKNTTLSREIELVATTPDEVRRLREFVRRRQGRAQPFWLPEQSSFQINSVTTFPRSAEIHYTEYAKLFESAPRACRNIMFQVPDYDTTTALVTSAEASAGKSKCTLSDANHLPAVKDAAIAVKLLKLYRLSEDIVDIRHLNGSVATCILPLIEIPTES